MCERLHLYTSLRRKCVYLAVAVAFYSNLNAESIGTADVGAHVYIRVSVLVTFLSDAFAPDTFTGRF